MPLIRTLAPHLTPTVSKRTTEATRWFFCAEGLPSLALGMLATKESLRPSQVCRAVRRADQTRQVLRVSRLGLPRGAGEKMDWSAP